MGFVSRPLYPLRRLVDDEEFYMGKTLALADHGLPTKNLSSRPTISVLPPSRALVSLKTRKVGIINDAISLASIIVKKSRV